MYQKDFSIKVAFYKPSMTWGLHNVDIHIHRVLIKIDNFRLDSQKRTAYSTDGLHIQIGTI